MSVWRLIKDGPLDGSENMAVDEALLYALEGSPSPPVLRLYRWKTPTLSIGRLQEDERLSRLSLPVVRRITGGRAVLHDSEITYSIVVPASHALYAGGILGAYQAISSCIASAFKGLNIDARMSRARVGRGAGRGSACFCAPSRHELTIDDKKIVGSAQRRLRNGFLQHGSILTGFDEGLNGRVFGPGLNEVVTWLGEHADVKDDVFEDMLVAAFSEGLNARFEPYELSPVELTIKNSILEGYAASALANSAALQTK